MLNAKKIVISALILFIVSSISGFGNSIASTSVKKNIEKGHLFEKKSTSPYTHSHGFALEAVFQSSIRLNAGHNLNLSGFNNNKKSSNHNVSYQITVDAKTCFVYYSFKRHTDVISLPLYIMYHRLAI